MKNILLALATLIPTTTSTFVKNTNFSQEVNYLYQSTDNKIKIDFNPNQSARANYDVPHQGSTFTDKEIILLKFTDIVPNLKDFFELFPYTTIYSNLKVKMYSAPPNPKLVHSYDNDKFTKLITKYIFKDTNLVLSDLDFYDHYVKEIDVDHVGEAFIYTSIDPNNIFHLKLRAQSETQGICHTACWRTDSVASISSIVFSS